MQKKSETLEGSSISVQRAAVTFQYSRLKVTGACQGLCDQARAEHLNTHKQKGQVAANTSDLDLWASLYTRSHTNMSRTPLRV